MRLAENRKVGGSTPPLATAKDRRTVCDLRKRRRPLRPPACAEWAIDSLREHRKVGGSTRPWPPTQTAGHGLVTCGFVHPTQSCEGVEPAARNAIDRRLQRDVARVVARIPRAPKRAIDWVSRPWGRNSFDHMPDAVISGTLSRRRAFEACRAFATPAR